MVAYYNINIIRNMTHRIIPVAILLTFLLAHTSTQAQYQLLNPGFESWEGTSATACPSHWSSFPQADGSWAWAASTAQHYHRNGGRPGSTGNSYLTIYSRSVLGVVANGNMTTGQIHAGSTSAASASNYNYTHRGSSYCHPFSGTPDSMYVWVSYYAASASSMGSVRAYLHGDSDFRDPNDCSDPTLYSGMAEAQFSRTTSSSTTPTWVQQRVPFTYDGTSSVNYILMSMTTNTTPGGGSAKDSLSVDDIEFIYSAWLDNLSINGTPIEGFQRDNLTYTLSLPDEASLSAATLSYVTQAADATVTIDTLTPDTFTRQFILHILAEDSLTSRTYTLTLTCPTPFEGINEPIHDSDAYVLRLYPNPSNSQVRCILPQGISTSGTLTLFDASGRAATTLQVSDTNSPTLDTSRLPAGTYTLVFQTEGHISSQRLVIIH